MTIPGNDTASAAVEGNGNPEKITKEEFKAALSANMNQEYEDRFGFRNNDTEIFERNFDDGEKIVVSYELDHNDLSKTVSEVKISRFANDGTVISEKEMTPAEFATEYFETDGDKLVLSDRISEYGSDSSQSNADPSAVAGAGAVAGALSPDPNVDEEAKEADDELPDSGNNGTETSELLKSIGKNVGQNVQSAFNKITGVFTGEDKSSEISKNNYDDFSKCVKKNGYTIAGLDIPTDADKYEIIDGKIIVTKGNDTIEYQLRHQFGGSEFIVTDANQDFNLDNLKGVLIKNLTIKTEDIRNVRDYVIENLLEYFDKDVLKISKNIIDEFPNLNEVTTGKLTLMSYGVDYLIEIYNSYQETIISHICEITSSLRKAIFKNEQANEGGSPVIPSGGGDIKFDDPKEYPSDSDNSSTITTPIEEVVAIDQETLTRLMPSVTGMVTFASIVSMYEKIGNNLPINSSETGQYGLIGVVQENSKYYYKLLDTKTGKVYFTEITEKSKITWDNKGERKVVEVKDENAMILKTPGESEDGLVRFAEKGDVYLLTGDEVNVDGIDYYNIMDSKTDTNNYIVSSDSVSSPKTISDLISSVDDSEVIK